jgi:acetyl-CoA carboxylase carboxyl transferase subunit alpha
MEAFVLDFEKPIAELEKQIREMKTLADTGSVDLADDIARLERKVDKLREDVYSKLNRWQKVQLARHPNRPYSLDYIKRICPQFVELHGDRLFRDDPSIICGIGKIDSRSFVIVGQQKGRGTKDNLYRNFGMPHPEGYRKALRVMKLGAKFLLPIVTLVDTPGAYPGLGAEERGQAEAIARNLFEMASLPVPIIAIVIGEGGSGGALALSLADRILMFEYSIYSVISPEGCASILYRDAQQAPKAAEALKLTSHDLLELGVIDGIIPEPLGGAHRNVDEMAEILKKEILSHIESLMAEPMDTLLEQRVEKYQKIGVWKE